MSTKLVSNLAVGQSMWLSKDERRLLGGYYRSIGQVNTYKDFRIEDLATLLDCCCRFRRTIPTYEISEGSQDDNYDLESLKELTKKYIAATCRIKRANELLAKRKLIQMELLEIAPNVISIRLELDGYDLGRRYSNPWLCSGLLYQEIQNHWIMLVLGFLGGVLGALVIDALK